MIFRLDDNPAAPFPDAHLAEAEPNGLLAVGGDLSAERIVSAYRKGIFPWFNEQDPILWWSPDPRTVLFPDRFKKSRSLRKTLCKGIFHVTYDEAFEQVIRSCSAPRAGSSDTWLLPEMIEAYRQLHDIGVAHSVEVMQGDQLVGGLYGLAIGQVFYGESMFSRVSDSSKVGLATLCEQLIEWGYRMIDCQLYTPHLVSLGAEEISRKQFCQYLDEWCNLNPSPEAWHHE
jgi:leucyl/phenylalanyl-tRNA--protein transferase